MPTSYATIADLTASGLPPAAVAELSDDQMLDELAKASEEVNGYLRARYTMPLTEWGADITGWTVDIAVWRILKFRGYTPEAGKDDIYRTAYMDATRALDQVSKRLRHPAIADSAKRSPVPVAFSPNKLRGW